MTPLSFAGYVRVSRVAGREGDSFLSPTLQRERIAAWCESQGHELVSITEDLDVSGASTSRARLEALIDAVEAERLDGVIVATLDRFGRSLPYAIALIDRINRAGGQFVSVADGFDTKTPYGELALNIMLSVAQFEVKRIRAQWRTIVERNIAAGRHPGAMPPFGYDRGTDGVLVPNEQASFVREMYSRAATGESLSSICRDLAGREIESQRGQRVTRSLVNVVLRNRAYLGEARSGDLVNPVAHERLVDDDLWRRTQSAFRGRPASRNREPATLAGLIRCQGCRYVMAPTMRERKRRYKCLGTAIGRSCPAPAFVTEAQLLPYIEAAFFDRLDEIVAQPASEGADVQQLLAARDDAVRQLTGYRDDGELPEVIGYESWKDGLRVRQRRLQDAEFAVAEATTTHADGLPDAATLRYAWREMDSDTRRRALGMVFDAIVVRKHPSRSERLRITDRVRLLGISELEAFEIPRSSRTPAKALAPFPWPRNPSSAWISLREPVLEEPADTR